MVFPLGHQSSGPGRRWSSQQALRAIAAAAMLAPPFAAGQADVENPPVLPELGADHPDALPELELPFLAVPFEEPATATALPNYVLPPVAEFLPLRAVKVPVLRCSGFEFEGNTVFSDGELRDCLVSYAGRELLSEDLDQVRFEITRHYVANGYLNSGATIPEPIADNGIVGIRVTEGRLTEVMTVGNKQLSDSYLSRRILMNRNRPLHFPTLQKRLQVLQGNDNITRLNAELKPGLVPGEALMVIEVGETPKWSYGLDVHNQRSPSVGGEQAELWMENRNTSGVSDVLRARLGLFSGNPEEVDFAGLDNLLLQYQRPIFADDTSLVLGWMTEDYSILEEPFRSLAVEGDSYNITAGLRRPLYRTLQDELWLSLLIDKSHDETTVLGRPFSVSPGSVDGELDLTQIRLGLDWTRRSRQAALSVRSVLSAGIDAMGSTDQASEPDGEFFTWFSETHYSRRINERGDLLGIHAGFGFSNDPLPPPAQFRLGGRYTVRGYRENFLVRDNGFCGGVDYRIPLLDDDDAKGWSLVGVPFVDGGAGWNDSHASSETLLSIGCGIVAEFSDWFRGELFWGFPLLNRDSQGDDIQDEGVHFRLSVARF